MTLLQTIHTYRTASSVQQYVKEERITTNSEGLKVAEATRRITEKASTNIGRIAYEIALLRDDPKLTIVHKSNVLATTDGLFRETVRNVQKSDKRFEKVKVEEQIVDSCVYKWVISFFYGYALRLSGKVQDETKRAVTDCFAGSICFTDSSAILKNSKSS